MGPAPRRGGLTGDRNRTCVVPSLLQEPLQAQSLRNRVLRYRDIGPQGGAVAIGGRAKEVRSLSATKIPKESGAHDSVRPHGPERRHERDATPRFRGRSQKVRTSIKQHTGVPSHDLVRRAYQLDAQVVGADFKCFRCGIGIGDAMKSPVATDRNWPGPATRYRTGDGTGTYSCRSCGIQWRLVGGRKPQAAPEKLAKGTINCFGCPPYISKPWCR